MTTSMTPEQARLQREQLERFNRWAQAEGVMELPVQISTYLLPAQRRRIEWLKDRIDARYAPLASLAVSALVKSVSVKLLEIGCSWGYVLAQMRAARAFRPGSIYRAELMGVDINPQLVGLARLLNRSAEFVCADARSLIGEDGRLLEADVVLLPEVLEHVEQADVAVVLAEAFRAARRQVLVTLPLEAHAAENVKHRWNAAVSIGWSIAEFSRIAKVWGFSPRLIDVDDDWLLMDAWKD